MSNHYTENPIRVNDQFISRVKVDVVDLCYSVALNGKMKRLLKNVSFNLDSGNLCALMGPSGAGKRLLLLAFHQFESYHFYIYICKSCAQ